MEKIDRELLIKEISARLPYGVKAQVYGWDEEKGEVEIPLRVYSINTDGYIYFETNDYDVNCLAVDACRLYLHPISSMTDEEKKELCQISEEYISNWFTADSNLLKWELDAKASNKRAVFYNSHHLDWNGLIPMGLALEAPENMYI